MFFYILDKTSKQFFYKFHLSIVKVKLITKYKNQTTIEKKIVLEKIYIQMLK